jgi:hypothetical protein
MCIFYWSLQKRSYKINKTLIIVFLSLSCQYTQIFILLKHRFKINNTPNPYIPIPHTDLWKIHKMCSLLSLWHIHFLCTEVLKII